MATNKNRKPNPYASFAANVLKITPLMTNDQIVHRLLSYYKSVEQIQKQEWLKSYFGNKRYRAITSFLESDSLRQSTNAAYKAVTQQHTDSNPDILPDVLEKQASSPNIVMSRVSTKPLPSNPQTETNRARNIELAYRECLEDLKRYHSIIDAADFLINRKSIISGYILLKLVSVESFRNQYGWAMPNKKDLTQKERKKK